MAYEEVTVIESPISTRYARPGCHGDIDHKTQMIRVGGAWFDYDPKKWKVVGNGPNQKREALLAAFTKTDFLTDARFVELCEAHAVTEEQAMEWMVETNNFTRYQLKTPGWSVHKTSVSE